MTKQGNDDLIERIPMCPIKDLYDRMGAARSISPDVCVELHISQRNDC